MLATVPEASANRGAFLVKLEAQPAAREKYLQTVRDWEDEKNRTSGSHFRQQPAAEGTVEATSSFFEARQFTGWLWPTALYAQHKGQKPSRKLLTTVTLQGKKHTGVILDEQGPPGTIQLWNVGQVGVMRKATLADSENNTAEELDHAMQHANELLNQVRAQHLKGTNMFGLSKAARKATEDSEDDDAILDAVWAPTTGKHIAIFSVAGSSSSGSKEKSSDEALAAATTEDDQPPLKRKRAHATSTSPSRSSRKRAAPKTPPSKAARVNKSRELDFAEQVALKAEQMLNSLADPKAFHTVTMQTYTALSEKIEGRLTSDLIQLYSQGFESFETSNGQEVDHTRGMKVFERLRQLQKKWPHLHGLISCYVAPPGCPNSQGHRLAREIEVVAGIGVHVCTSLREMVLERAGFQSAGQDDYQCCAKLLSWRASDAQQTLGPLDGVSAFPEGTARELQKRLVCRVIQDLLRSEGEEGSTRKMHAAMRNLELFSGSLTPPGKDAKHNAAVLLDLDLHKDVSKLYLVVSSLSMTDDNETQIQEAEAARSELVAAKNGMFLKALTLFSTGIYILKTSSACFLQQRADVIHAVVLESLREAAEQLQPSASAGDSTRGPDPDAVLATYADMWSKITGIQANASKSFQNKYKCTMDKVLSALQNHIDALDARITSRLRDALDWTCKVAVEILQSSTNQIHADTLAIEFMKLVDQVVDAAGVGLVRIAGAGVVEAFNEKQTATRQALRGLAESSAWMLSLRDGDECELFGDTLKKVLQHCMVLATAVGHVECAGLHDFCSHLKRQVMAHLSSDLREGLSSCVAFVKAFAEAGDDVSHVFEKELTGQGDDDSADLTPLLQLATVGREVILPALPGLGANKLPVLHLDGKDVCMYDACTAPFWLVTGQALVRCTAGMDIDMEAEDNTGSMWNKRLLENARVVANHLEAARLIALSLEESQDQHRRRADACFDFCSKKLKDLVYGIFEACKSRVADTMEKAREVMESDHVRGPAF